MNINMIMEMEMEIYSADPMQALSVKFLTKEDAILFAERQGYDYWIDIPKEGVFKVKQYSENFKVGFCSLSLSSLSILSLSLSVLSLLLSLFSLSLFSLCSLCSLSLCSLSLVSLC